MLGIDKTQLIPISIHKGRIAVAKNNTPNFIPRLLGLYPNSLYNITHLPYGSPFTSTEFTAPFHVPLQGHSKSVYALANHSLEGSSGCITQDA